MMTRVTTRTAPPGAHVAGLVGLLLAGSTLASGAGVVGAIVDCDACFRGVVFADAVPGRHASASRGGPLIDVMIVYTPASRIAVGGEAAILAIIDDHVLWTNEVYAASGVSHRLRLVHANEIAYVESGNSITDLQRLQDPNDGFMDDVHPLRDAWGADLVCLINDSGSAGVGYLMQVLSVGFADRAFSAIAPDVGGLVFAHETGHNMGCAHNASDGTDTIFCYSFGHRTPDDQWRTIMSSSPGTYVDFYSSPDLEWKGQPLGVSGDGCPPDAADNVRSLNNAAATVAQFRPTVVPECPEDLDDSGAVDFGDILAVLAAWGPCADCPEDLDGSGAADFGDILVILASWGPC